MYKTKKVQKSHLKCSIYKIGGATAVFVLLVLQIIQTFGPPDIFNAPIFPEKFHSKSRDLLASFIW